MEFDFEANASVQTIEIVPEEYRTAYVEDKANSCYVIKPEFKGIVGAYTGVSKALKTAGVKKKSDNDADAARRHTLKAVTDVLTEVGFEPGDDLTKLGDIVRTKITELQGLVKGGKEVKVDLDKIRAQSDKTIAEIRAASEADKVSMTKTLEEYMIVGAAASAMAEAKVVDKGVDFLMPHVLKATRMVKDETGKYVVRVVDAENAARSDGKGGYMDVATLVKEMKTTFPMAFESPKKAGGSDTQQKSVLKQPDRREEQKSSVGKIEAGLASLKK